MVNRLAPIGRRERKMKTILSIGFILVCLLILIKGCLIKFELHKIEDQEEYMEGLGILLLMAGWIVLAAWLIG